MPHPNLSLNSRCSSCQRKSTCCNKIYLTQNLILNDKTFSEPTTTVINNEHSLEIPHQETSCAYSAGNSMKQILLVTKYLFDKGSVVLDKLRLHMSQYWSINNTISDYSQCNTNFFDL